MPEPSVQTAPKSIEIPGAIVIKDLAAKLNIPVTRVIAELMKSGVMSSMNERIDFDTAAIIAEDLGFQLILKEESEDDRAKTIAEQLAEHFQNDNQEKQIIRSPVVVVMGHVDHGKTKLLDAIRETNIAEKESGGITQHIGAYQVEKKGKIITFIDTPGHQAFSAMRSRGAQVADIAVLVIAADDGFKPQTLEAIKIIQQAKVPFLVAINKVDKPDINLERIKQQLSEQNLLPEEWGGQTIIVAVSAKTGQGVDDLLEHIALLADVGQDKLKADPTRPAVGSVIEAHIDPGEGPVATVLVRTGTLRQGDNVKIGSIVGRVKLLKDWKGNVIPEAGPSVPAKMLGLKMSPEVGDILSVVDDRAAKLLRREQKTVTERATSRVVYRKKRQESEKHAKQEQIKLNVVLRCDNLGSQEAILESLQKYETTAVGVEIIAKGLGSITEADVLRSDAAHALLIGFHVIPTPQAAEVAKSKQVEIRTYTVIYDLLNDIHKEAESKLPTEVLETAAAQVKILAVFKKDKKGMVVGGKVTEGALERGAKVHVVRNGERLGDGAITQVQQEKRIVDSVKNGSECGMRFDGPTTILQGDMLEAFITEERRQTLHV